MSCCDLFKKYLRSFTQTIINLNRMYICTYTLLYIYIRHIYNIHTQVKFIVSIHYNRVLGETQKSVIGAEEIRNNSTKFEKSIYFNAFSSSLHV